MRSLDQLDISGKKLLLRVDCNVPLDAEVINDDIRIRASLPTLRYALTIVGGGDTDSMIHEAHQESKMGFIPTGGGSFLEFLEGKELPAFTALKECGA